MTHEEKKEFCESINVEYDSGCRSAVAEELANIHGIETMYFNLIQALSDDEAFENLEYVHRMHS